MPGKRSASVWEDDAPAQRAKLTESAAVDMCNIPSEMDTSEGSELSGNASNQEVSQCAVLTGNAREGDTIEVKTHSSTLGDAPDSGALKGETTECGTPICEAPAGPQVDAPDGVFCECDACDDVFLDEAWDDVLICDSSSSCSLSLQSLDNSLIELCIGDQTEDLAESDESDEDEAGYTLANRLKLELLDLILPSLAGMQIKLIDGNIFTWAVTVDGINGTPYEGGRFQLKIVFPLDHPRGSPKVEFQTRIFHCNVYNNRVCENMWSPGSSVMQILLCIQGMMSRPIVKDAKNLLVAQLYKTNRKKHDEKAREWTSRYAKRPN